MLLYYGWKVVWVKETSVCREHTVDCVVWVPLEQQELRSSAGSASLCSVGPAALWADRGFYEPLIFYKCCLLEPCSLKEFHLRVTSNVGFWALSHPALERWRAHIRSDTWMTDCLTTTEERTRAVFVLVPVVVVCPTAGLLQLIIQQANCPISQNPHQTSVF